MNTIWKYELEFEKITRLQVPKDAEILTVQRDDKTNKPYVWALVNTENEKEERFFDRTQYNLARLRSFASAIFPPGC